MRAHDLLQVSGDEPRADTDRRPPALRKLGASRHGEVAQVLYLHGCVRPDK